MTTAIHTKTCTRCHTTRPVTEFSRGAGYADGYLRASGDSDARPGASILVGGRRAAITEDLRQIFVVFSRSSAFAELSCATILGREIPLLRPAGDQVMEGVIDLLYERHGSLYIADYKTDRVAPGRWPEIRAHYRRQAALYSYGVRQSLQRDVKAFKLFFLRAGKTIELKTNTPQGELFSFEP